MKTKPKTRRTPPADIKPGDRVVIYCGIVTVETIELLEKDYRIAATNGCTIASGLGNWPDVVVEPATAKGA